MAVAMGQALCDYNVTSWRLFVDSEIIIKLYMYILSPVGVFTLNYNWVIKLEQLICRGRQQPFWFVHDPIKFSVWKKEVHKDNRCELAGEKDVFILTSLCNGAFLWCMNQNDWTLCPPIVLSYIMSSEYFVYKYNHKFWTTSKIPKHL